MKTLTIDEFVNLIKNTPIDKNRDYCLESGIKVVNNDGQIINDNELKDLIRRNTGIDTSDLSILNEDKYRQDDENDRTLETRTYIVRRENERDLMFTGVKLGCVTSHNANERWTELAIYLTKGGTYICEQIGHTKVAGERTRYSAAVCETINEIVEFFGCGWLAKDLYFEAAVDTTEKID